MATYQGAEFLGEQLESIAKQTRQPDELIVSDDCSTDETVAIANRFAEGAPFAVRIFLNERNLGFSGNFERALAKSEGDLIFFSDQDDVWFPGKIERITAEFERSAGVLAVIHDQRTLDQRSGRIFERSYFDNQKALGLADKELVSGNFTALRRELVNIVLPFPPQIAYDFWIARLSTALNCRAVIREPLQLYRRHSSNLSQPVLSNPRPTLLSELRRMGPKDPRPHWLETLEQCQLASTRVQERSGAIDECLGQGRAKASLAGLSLQMRSLERRIEVMSLPPLRRRIEVFRSWRGGVYDQFSGAKSAIRDLLQPLPRRY